MDDDIYVFGLFIDGEVFDKYETTDKDLENTKKHFRESGWDDDSGKSKAWEVKLIEMNPDHAEEM